MSCKWCGSRVIDTMAPGIRPGWSRWMCSGCGALGYHTDPAPAALASIYQKAWEEPDSGGRYAAGSTSRNIATELLKIGFMGQKNIENCLDYGSGKGFMAKLLTESGCQNVHVIEPFGPDACLPGVEWHRSWEELPPGLCFDRIFMVEVVEHLLDPVNELLKAKSFLTDTGMVFLTTPNARGWRARLDKGRWREAQNPTHLNLFSFQALTLCLKSAGYSEIKRMNKTISYEKRGISSLILKLTQLLRVDGGLRVLAR